MRNKDIPATLGFMVGLILGTFLSARLGLGNIGRILLCIACAAACGYLADLAYKRSRPPQAGPPPGPPGFGPGGRIPAYCPRCGATIDANGVCPNCGKAA